MMTTRQLLQQEVVGLLRANATLEITCGNSKTGAGDVVVKALTEGVKCAAKVVPIEGVQEPTLALQNGKLEGMIAILTVVRTAMDEARRVPS